MKVHSKTETDYICEVCNASYKSEQEARKCESRPLLYDKGVKVGDTVLITRGEGTGQQAKVTKITTVDKSWGHYQWEKYWHTVMVEADIINSWGSRILTFDSYEPVY